MAYQRSLNLENGLLSYSYDYARQVQKPLVSVSQRRFVSMEQKHLAVFETVIRAHQQYRSKLLRQSMHARRWTDAALLRGGANGPAWAFALVRGRTVSSETAFKVGVRVKVFLDGQELPDVQRYATTRRLVSTRTGVLLNKGSELCIVRYALFYTQHDPQWGNLNGKRSLHRSNLRWIAFQSSPFQTSRKSEEE